jgi:hypothetical protein
MTHHRDSVKTENIRFCSFATEGPAYANRVAAVAVELGGVVFGELVFKQSPLSADQN